MSFCVIVNPIAGTGRAKKVWSKLEKILTEKKIEFSVYFTEYAGHATELVKKLIEEGKTSFLSVGGDGTSYEIACGLRGKDASLGIIPAGTGNDFVKALGIPKNPIEALSFFLSHNPRPVDCAVLNGDMFLNACGTGFDVTVLQYALKAKKYVKGLLPYLYGVVKTVFHFKPTNIRLEADGKEIFSGDVLVVAINNGPYYGGGIKISPNAMANDGKLEIVLMKPVFGKRKLLSKLPGLLGGKILTFPETSTLRADKVIIDGKEILFNIDGELKPIEHAEIEIVPSGIMMNY